MQAHDIGSMYNFLRAIIIKTYRTVLLIFYQDDYVTNTAMEIGMDDILKEILDELNTAYISNDQTKVDEVTKKLKDYLAEYHENFKTEFSTIEEKIRQSLDPVSMLSVQLSELRETTTMIRSDLDKNIEEDKLAREDILTNSELLTKHEKGLHTLDFVASNLKKVFALFGISLLTLGSVIYYFVTSTVQDEAIDFKNEIKREAQIVQDEIEKQSSEVSNIIDANLSTSSLVREATKIVNRNLETKYLLGSYHRALAYTNDALYKLDRLVASNNFHEINPFRIDELRVYMYSFRQSLRGFNEETPQDSCDEIKRITARLKISVALSDWTSGFFSEAFNTLKIARYECDLPEIRYLYYWLDKATSLPESHKDHYDTFSEAFKSGFVQSNSSNAEDLKLPTWKRLLTVARVYELCLKEKEYCKSLDSGEGSVEENSIRLDDTKREIYQLRSTLNAKSVKDLFIDISTEKYASRKIKLIAKHYATYIEWDEQNQKNVAELGPAIDDWKPYNKNYIIEMINIQSEWPSFIKIKSNFVDRFHPCYLKQRNSKKTDKNEFCEKYSELKSHDHSYFDPIEDLSSWVDYLEKFYEMNRDSESYTVTDSLKSAYRTVLEYTMDYNNLDSSLTFNRPVFEQHFLSMLNKMCTSTTFHKKIIKVKNKDIDRYNRLISSVKESTRFKALLTKGIKCKIIEDGTQEFACIRAIEQCNLLRELKEH